ncbi:SET domain-containing protein SmydA-8 isoform X2 [Teleopsis dalmanni]|nr:SET domain-containing protein SmydA-8 isoform X2 [Teleopsis dalmanni]XP_037960922.1 SET domain-containing protein SmydA-8 isoform X2 [Teleopsis dalmanni]XP_037960923.1 SET domain-containing protein SmydA-8 isoform X2 [Teleopsis dalmanni]
MQKTRVENHDDFKRCMVAAEPLTKGDIIVEELPYAFGPKQNSDIVCLGCYRSLDFGEDGDSMDRCYICDWPLCSTCSDLQVHQGECEIFFQANVTFAGNVSEDGVCTQLDCITPLRILLAKENDPIRWEREIAQMEYHDRERRALTEIWNADRINIAQYLRGPCMLADRFSEDLIMQVVGILEVNAFEARTPEGYTFRCIYPNTAVLAHNCVPNVTRSVYPSEGYKVRLRTMRDLEEGEQLFLSYTYTLDGTKERQDNLKNGKFFLCMCDRCKDPTELGTHFSSIKCHKCIDGLVTNLNPLDNNAEWKCNICEFQMSQLDMSQYLSTIETEIESVKQMGSSSQRLELTEEYLEKFENVLHPLHYLLTGMRQNLIEMYGRVEGYQMIELSNSLLERKIDLCRQLLLVLEKFEPGLSRTSAMVMYELHVPLVLLAKRAFDAGTITVKSLEERIIEPIALLRQCVQTLQYEDTFSQEGVLGQIAQEALQKLSTNFNALHNQ